MKPELKKNLKYAIIDLEYEGKTEEAQAVEEAINDIITLEYRLNKEERETQFTFTTDSKERFELYEDFLGKIGVEFGYAYDEKGKYYNFFIIVKGATKGYAVENALKMFVMMENYFHEREQELRMRYSENEKSRK